MNDLISVIIPVYNVEKYLERCVDSVLAQTYKNLEVILVDDGSTDNCGKICDEYAGKDDRVKSIHIKNSGAACGRNAGLDIASGEYVAFVDSDDWYFDDECLKNVVENFEKYNSDIVLLPSIKFFENDESYQYTDKKYNTCKMTESDKKDALLYAMTYDAFKACPWDKVVKRELIENTKLRFITGAVAEDIDWCGRLLLCSERVSCLESPVYVYRQRQSSVSHSINIKYVKDILMQINSLLKVKCKKDDEILIKTYLAHNYVMLVECFNKVKICERKKYKKEIKKLSFLLEYDQSLNVKKVHMVKKCLGFDVMRFVLKIFR